MIDNVNVELGLPVLEGVEVVDIVMVLEGVIDTVVVCVAVTEDE